MSDPPPTRKSARQQPRSRRASVSPPRTPPAAVMMIPSASQIAAASSSAEQQQYTTHDIFGGASDSELSDLTESDAGMGREEEEEEEVKAKLEDGPQTVPPPRGASPVGKEPTSSGEGIKRHSKTIQSSDEEDSEGASLAADREARKPPPRPIVIKARGRKDSPVREPARKSREEPEEEIAKVYAPDGLDARDRETEPKPRPRPKKLTLTVKRSEREVSDSEDRPAKSGHEQDSDKAGKRKVRPEAGRNSTERDGRGSSPVVEPPVKRKSDRDERRDTTSQHVRRSKRDRRDDDAYDDASDYARRSKDGSRADGETRKGKPRREEGDVERGGRTVKAPRGEGEDVQRDEEKRVKQPREASVDPAEPRKRKAGEAERSKEAHRERKRPVVDSDGDDVKEVVAPSHDVPLKKKKRPLTVDTADHPDTKKKHALADRPALKREDSALEGELSRVPKRPGQAKPAKRIAELSAQGARTPGDKPRTPNTGEPGSSRRLGGVQAKKPYDPLAGALSSLAGIGPGTASGASTPINRKPLLKSDMAPAAELTEAREQAQKKREELYAKQVQLNSMSHGLLIREYEDRPKPWLKRAGIPRDDVTGKYAEATVQAIIKLRDEGYFGENIDTWP